LLINLNKFNVVDSIMGSGKTMWAFDYMYKEKNQKFIYVTPYLDEIDRLLYLKDDDGVPVVSDDGYDIGTKWYYNRGFREPKHLGEGKLNNLHRLLDEGRNIATTHALLKMCTDETLELIQEGGYNLILDEALDIVDIIDNLKIKDYEMMINSNNIRVNENKLISWIDPTYDGEFIEFRRKCENGTMVEIKKSNRLQLLVWNFNFKSLNVFKKIYILTYLFDASFIRYYFDIHNISYRKWCIEDRVLIDYGQKKPYGKDDLKRLINIYDGKLNNIGDRRTALSVNWYRNYSKKRVLIRNNINNYFKNIIGVKSGDALWTTFKSSQKALSYKGYKSSFAPCNTRATNEYRDKIALAYCVNRFLSPDYEKYFMRHDIVLDQDMFALSEMIQWIWRSAIRDGKPINIYIPSKRMRTLLIDWLNNENI